MPAGSKTKLLWKDPVFRARMVKAHLFKNMKHGFASPYVDKDKMRFYNIWQLMKQRCLNKNLWYYKHYGGRGITIEWKTFDDFHRDMYPLYLEHIKIHGKDVSIERIDNDRNYAKDNCRWATRKEQGQNRRTNLMYNGETAKTAGFRLGGSQHLVTHRIRRRGWSLEKAFTTPSLRLPQSARTPKPE